MKVKEKAQINTKFLDGLRVIFALWVLLDHFYAYIGGENFVHIPFGEQLLNGSIPVSGFMIITGFLMMYHYLLKQDIELPNQSKTLYRFWLKRLFRLYPIYFIAIITAFLTVPVRDKLNVNILNYFTKSNINGYGEELIYSSNYPSIVDLFSHLTFLHGLIPQNAVSILGPAWSLSLEMQFYLVFPFLFLIFFYKKKSMNLSVLSLLFISTVIAIIMPILFGIYSKVGILTTFPQPSVILYQLPLFVYGMLLATVALKKIKWEFLILGMVSIALTQGKMTILVVLIITVLMFLEKINGRFTATKLLYNVFKKANDFLSSRGANLGANLSYSVYLLHLILLPFVVQISINFFSVITTNKLIIASLSLIFFLTINILVSYFLYYKIEILFIKMGKNLLRIQNSNRNEGIKQSS
ncbi:acyltransferase family protein [Niallia circulans]|uniref:acyltransferase family protein n=1 Tax=Niallia circulans TaxID=1397 RepID=UPI0016399DA2|nr:acyltransferase [Niallia circulans]